jgi:hypothetical protein
MSTRPECDSPNAARIQGTLADLPEDSPQNKTTSKLDIDRPQDFKFHLAYGVYARAWETNTSEAARIKLNDLISSLSKDDADSSYFTFYTEIDQYRKDTMQFRPGRTRIQTQRKRDWQRTDSRDRRNGRHR